MGRVGTTEGAAAATGGAHTCTGCGHSSPSWFGRCPACGAWSSAAAPAPEDGLTITTPAGAARGVPRLRTGLAEVDLVLGGGLVPGAVALLAGEPGIGKSTLVMQVISGLIAARRRCLLLTGEESVDQVGLRAARLGAPLERVRVATSTSLGAVVGASRRERPDVLVVDSIQAVADDGLEHQVGSVGQVRSCATALARHAKESATSVLLVGHVTKDGSVAGPKALEHVVDAVLTLEGERSGSLRLLRATKNRYGSCEETGVLTLGSRGLEPVGDPSALLLADRRRGISGSVVFAALEGSRPVLTEVQALVSEATKAPNPRRVASGLDPRRLALLLGVLHRRAGLPLSDHDVFVASVGGLSVREPAGDLALCLALWSAHAGAPMDPATIAVGEVGLGGEIRRVPGMQRRLREAARMGFARALVPRAGDAPRAGIELVCVRDLRDALRATSGARARGSRHARSAEEADVLPSIEV